MNLTLLVNGELTMILRVKLEHKFSDHILLSQRTITLLSNRLGGSTLTEWLSNTGLAMSD